jgi:hypothetical protein
MDSSRFFANLRRLPLPLRAVVVLLLSLTAASTTAACGGSSKSAANDPQAAIRANHSCNIDLIHKKPCGPAGQLQLAVKAHGWKDGLGDAKGRDGDNIQIGKTQSVKYNCGAWMVLTKPASNDKASDAQYSVYQVISLGQAKPPILAKDLPASLRGADVTEAAFDAEVKAEIKREGKKGPLVQLCPERKLSNLFK